MSTDKGVTRLGDAGASRFWLLEIREPGTARCLSAVHHQDERDEPSNNTFSSSNLHLDADPCPHTDPHPGPGGADVRRSAGHARRQL